MSPITHEAMAHALAAADAWFLGEAPDWDRLGIGEREVYEDLARIVMEQLGLPG